MRVVGVLVLLVSAPILSLAQTKTPIELDHTGKDNAGRLFAFELKEAIRGSQSMRLLEGPSVEPRIRVLLVSIDATGGSQTGIRTAVSTSILYDSVDVPLGGAYLTSLVQICGRNVMAACARDLLADIDREIESLRTRSPNLWRTIHGDRSL